MKQLRTRPAVLLAVLAVIFSLTGAAVFTPAVAASRGSDDAIRSADSSSDDSPDDPEDEVEDESADDSRLRATSMQSPEGGNSGPGNAGDLRNRANERAQEALAKAQQRANEARQKVAQAQAEAEKRRTEALQKGGEKLTTARKRACDKRETTITNLMKRINNRGGNHVQLITTVSQRVQAFYTQQGLTVENYDVLLSAVASAKANAEAAKAAVDSAQQQFDCDGTDPTGTAASFKQLTQARNEATKAYRDAVKQLIDAVKAAAQAKAQTTPATSTENQ